MWNTPHSSEAPSWQEPRSIAFHEEKLGLDLAVEEYAAVSLTIFFFFLFYLRKVICLNPGSYPSFHTTHKTAVVYVYSTSHSLPFSFGNDQKICFRNFVLKRGGFFKINIHLFQGGDCLPTLRHARNERRSGGRVDIFAAFFHEFRDAD